MSRNCFWDRYWERAGQLLASFPRSLVTVPEFFAKLTRLSSFSFLKWRILCEHVLR